MSKKLSLLFVFHPRHRQNPMRSTHESLSEKSNLYRSWQRSPHRRVVSYGTLALTIIIILSVIAANLIVPFQQAQAASNSWTFGDPSGYTVGSGITTASGNATLSTPGSTTGSAVNLNPKTGVSSNGAAQFTAANKDYLTIPSNASLQTGDIDFEVGAWVNLDTVSSGSQTIISKGTSIGSMTSYEYALYYSGPGNAFTYGISNGTSERTITATTFGIPTAGTWNFIRCYHQTSDSKYYIQVNNGVADSLVDNNTFPSAAGTTAFNLGGNSGDTRFLNGRIDSAYSKKSISTSGEATALYNAGAGRTYADLTAGNGLSSFQTALTSWWDLNEESGQRYDAKGTNHLTSAAGQIIVPPVYGAELVTNGGFETAGAGGADVFANWTETALGTSTINNETADTHTGGHACRLDIDATQSYTQVSNTTILSIGSTYSVSFWAKASALPASLGSDTFGAGLREGSLSTNWTQFTWTGVATQTGLGLKRVAATSKSIYIDDVSIKEITTASLLNGGFETAGAGGADVFGSWAETVAGTSTVNDETAAPYAGSHAMRWDVDASNSAAQIVQTVLTVGKRYKTTYYAKASAGTPTMKAGTITAVVIQGLTTSWTQYTAYFVADSTTFSVARQAAGSSSIYIDQVTLESIGPLSDAGIAAGASVDGNYAAQFNGTQSLTIPSNASIQTGDIDYEVGAWVYLNDTKNQDLFHKSVATGSQKSFYLVISSKRVAFSVSGDGATAIGVNANNFGDVAAGQWMYVRAWHDSVNNQIGIQVNNGTPNTVSYSSGIFAGTAPFSIGDGYAWSWLTGRIDGIYVRKAISSTAEVTALFNNGKGLKYSQLPDSIKNDANLKGYWDLDEKSGTRYDSTSNANNLTDNGTVTQGYGVNYFAGAVSQINDISGNNKNFTQATQSKRPVYSTLGINNKPALQFDGVDDALVKTGDQIGTGDVTITTVIKPRGWGGGGMGRIIDTNAIAMDVSSSGSIVLGGGLTAISASSSIVLNNTYIVSATRKSDGKTNIYINGVLSGSTDQISTVAAGSDTYLGNRADGARAFDGYIGTTQIYSSILSDSQRNQIEKTLGNVYGITVASTAQTAATSIFPNLSTNAPLRYTTLQTFGETLGGGSTGTLRYQLSNDPAADNITSATWYYYTGGAWTTADKNNAWQSNTAAEVNTNLATFASTVSPGHNLKWRTFFVTDGVDNPVLQSVNTTYIADTEAPNNPTLATAKNALGGSTDITTNNWYNYATPSFTWNVPGDPSTLEFEQSSGLAGYLTYFGTDNAANVTLVNNVVTTGADNGAYKWQTGTTLTSAATLASGSTHYLKVIAVDNAGNAHYDADSATYNLFTYKYDGAVPTAPLYVSVTPSGYSRTNNFTFNWPVGGGSEATDTGGSGLAKYQYKVNSEANWHDVAGDATTSTLTLTDAATSGLNIFSLQALDTAGNVSPSVRTNFYFNNTAPNAPANLTATPTTNTDNAFGFTWTASPGEIAGYYYSVNTIPTLSNANFTTSTSLAAGPYATQQGQNILYVVAKDNAGNYDFSGCSQASLSYNSNTDTCAAVAFMATTTAPGVPGGLEAFDSSTRNTQKYLVTLSWTAPADPGAGFDGYDVYRSTDGIAYSKIGSTSSTAYADNGLESRLYFYYIVAKDNAGNFSAITTPVSITPTGRFTSPPVLVSGPTITVNPTSLEVSWVTDREASSFVSIKNGNTFVSEQGENTQTLSHSVKVVGLKSQSNYTFNIRSTDIDGNSLVGADQEFKTANTPSVYDLVVSNITQTSAIINFKSTAIANFTLYYGETADYGQTVPEDSSSSTTNHSLALSALKPGTMYYFRVRGDDADGNELRSENSFATLPMPEISNFTIEPDKEAATTTLKVSWKTNVPTTSILRYASDGVTFKELSTSDMVTDHEITISDLEDQKKYTIYAAGRDQFGNLAESDRVTFDTPKDSRPPKISDFIVESQANEQGGDTFKVVVSWKTDEPATSKVEFGVGIGDSNLTQSSTETITLETYHVVVVSGLESSQVYQFRAVSKDGESNLVKSDVQILVTNQPTQTIFELIMQSLERAFGWMGKLFM